MDRRVWLSVGDDRRVLTHEQCYRGWSDDFLSETRDAIDYLHRLIGNATMMARLRTMLLASENTLLVDRRNDREVIREIAARIRDKRMCLERYPVRLEPWPAARVTPPPPPRPTPPQPRPPQPKKEDECRFIEIHWDRPETWCSEGGILHGKSENCPDRDLSGTVTAKEDGKQEHSFTTQLKSNAFTWKWPDDVTEVLPGKDGAHYRMEKNLDGEAEGVKTPKPLKIRFIPKLKKTPYKSGRDHFELSATDYEIKIESEIKFVKGWGGEVVKLGNSAPAGTGGLLDGQLTWSGYRWMKSAGLGKVFWDGTAWQPLPATFVLADANNFCVGFYKTGTTFTSQYGGTWPESFTDWDVNAEDKQKKIKAWTKNINDTWTGQFFIKRKECKSKTPECCRYSTVADASFKEVTAMADDVIIIADGNIRSNDRLFFIDEPRIAMAAHEFGHHLGNPDEYAGAKVEATLNEDGAVNGIDADSIMGQNMTKVKKRHYRTICKHFASMVKAEYGKTYTYEAQK